MSEISGSRPASVRVRSTEDGLHLDGSILWFDAQKNGDLTFLSSASVATSNGGPQVIATEETIKILEARRKKPKALVCQYNRPFSIGRLKMELLPSGCVLGGAILHLETENKRILYAPSLQTHKIATVRQMQLKKAHTLILGTTHPDPNAAMPNRKKERDRLLTSVNEAIAENVYPIIYCETTSIAPELTKFLLDNQIPVAVHPSIFRINRVYEACGSKLGHYSLHSDKWTKKKVILFPLPENRTTLRTTSERRIFIVEDTMAEPADKVRDDNAANVFYLSSTCDGRELREIIAAVAPKEVYVFGPYAKRYVHELKASFPKIKALYTNSQPPLF